MTTSTSPSGPQSWRISLLHATYRRIGGPGEIERAWHRAAEQPDLVEYVVAMDADDPISVPATEGRLRALTGPGDGWVTSVANWNAAAATATGDLLIVIADDLYPPPGWDRQLRDLIGPLDPRATSFAVKITDSPYDDDTCLRHPVISRRYYEGHGLFAEQYHGLYCDRDFTTRAFWEAVILDGRSVVLDHRNPHYDDTIEASASQASVSSEREYDHGRQTYAASWSVRHRTARIHLVPTDRPQDLRAERLDRFGRSRRRQESAAYLGRRILGLPRQVIGKLTRRPSGTPRAAPPPTAPR